MVCRFIPIPKYLQFFYTVFDYQEKKKAVLFCKAAGFNE